MLIVGCNIPTLQHNNSILACLHGMIQPCNTSQVHTQYNNFCFWWLMIVDWHEFYQISNIFHSLFRNWKLYSRLLSCNLWLINLLVNYVLLTRRTNPMFMIWLKEYHSLWCQSAQSQRLREQKAHSGIIW